MGCIRTSGVINIKNCNQTSIKQNFNVQKKENINNDNLPNNYSNEEICEKNASEIDDKYLIFEKIYKNLLSSYYKIQCIENENIFKTMKVFKKNIIKQNNDKSIFREIRNLKKINHENLVRVEGIYEDKINYYIIFDYSPYGLLENILKKKKRFSENQAKIIINQILNGIKYLNSNNFIHSNLKPENILISEKINIDKEEYYKIKLINFGSENSFQKKSNENIPYYSAPELFKNIYNSKCDIWSIGILLFQLIYGYKPYKGNSLEEFIENLTNKEIKYENKEEENFNLLSEEGKNFIQNLLNKDNEKRFDINLCLNHNWIKNDNKLNLIKEYKYIDDSYSIHYKRNNTNWSIKAQFNNSDSKDFHTGFYKIENHFTPKKLKNITQIPNKDFYHLFLHSLIKYMGYYFTINYRKNKEEVILLKLYNESKNIIKENYKNLYKSVLQYCGVLTFSVRYICFKEKVKNDININFSNESIINFGVFENLLIQEKKNYIEIELLYYFEKFENNQCEEIIRCLNFNFHKKENYQNYFDFIKEELNNNIQISFDDFKFIINNVIDKLNSTTSNTFNYSNIFSYNYSNNATFNETFLEKSIITNEDKDKESIIKENNKLFSNKKLKNFSYNFKKKNSVIFDN